MYGKNAAGVLANILGHIVSYCIDNELPPLTSIVVGAHSGTPGIHIPADPAEIDRECEKVYQQDWYDVYPPSEAELSAAMAPHPAN
jgi:hypothetical protein